MIDIEEKEEFVIIFYKKDDGTEPAKEFLDGLDNKMRAKMIRTVELLRDYGYELREPYSKHLNDGIFELRAKVSTDITRVLYFFCFGSESYTYTRLCQENAENTAVGNRKSR